MNHYWVFFVAHKAVGSSLRGRKIIYYLLLYYITYYYLLFITSSLNERSQVNPCDLYQGPPLTVEPLRAP